MSVDRPRPDAAAPPEGPVDAFRAAMRQMGSTVCVITTRAADGSWRGATINSMTSVSLRPPSLLVSLDSAARIHPAVLSRGSFAVSLFASHHRGMAAVFADPLRHGERFTAGAWRLEDGLPVLGDAVATFVCRVGATLPYATHTIVVGVVDRVFSGEGEPLLYHDRRYGGFAPDEPS